MFDIAQPADMPAPPWFRCRSPSHTAASSPRHTRAFSTSDCASFSTCTVRRPRRDALVVLPHPRPQPLVADATGACIGAVYLVIHTCLSSLVVTALRASSLPGCNPSFALCCEQSTNHTLGSPPLLANPLNWRAPGSKFSACE